jgi:DNA-binding SARP family transcriptional activator
MPIRVELLGRPRILDADGKPIEFPLGKPLALLAYLLVEGQPASRRDLADLIWPNASREKARQSTRQAIWHIRRTLGEETILGADEVSVSPDHVESDVGEFRGALDEGAIDRARSLWRGPLCNNLTLSNCRPWERWLEERRDQTDDLFFRGLLEAGEALREGGDPADASAYLQEAVTQRPESVQAWRHYVEALLDLGDAREAEAALREMSRRALEEDDGPDVLSPLLERLEAVRAVSTRGPDTDRVTDHLEFVGRSEEMATLRSYWRRTGVGGMGLVSVLGPTGIGKTRLCREVIAFAESNKGHTAVARGFESEAGIPHGTAADLVGSLLDLPGAAGISSASDLLLRSIVPSKNGRRPGQEEGVPIHPAALADALADLVEAVSFESPLIVWIDDYQWVDAESRAAFSKIARRLDRVPCLFLLAERTRSGNRSSAAGDPGGKDADTQASGSRGMAGQGPVGRGSGGQGLSGQAPASEALAISLGGRRLRLAPLSLEETGEMLGLLAQFSNPEAADEIVSRVQGATGGNPFFVGELLRHFVHEGICRVEGRTWVLQTDQVPQDLELPESVRTLLEARLDRVPERAEALLYELAIAGRALPAHVILGRVEMDEAAFSETVAALESEEIIWTNRSRALDFTHDQLRAAAKDRYQPGVGEAGATGNGQGRRWGWILGSAAGLVAAGLILLFGFGPLPPFLWVEEEAPTYPYGQGVILVADRAAGTGVILDPPDREGDAWTTRPYEGWVPHNNAYSNVTPHLGPDGRMDWYAAVSEPSARPYAARVGPGGVVEPIYRSDADDGVRDALPGTEELLLTTVNPSAESDEVYPIDLLLRSDPEAPPEVLYEAQGHVGPAFFSADGQRIFLQVQGVHDTVVVLHPDGSVETKREFAEYRSITGSAWCGLGTRILVTGPLGDSSPFLLFDPSTGDVEPVESDPRFRGQPLCLGDGRALAYVGLDDRRPSILIQDLETEEVVPFPVLETGTAVELHWLPDPIPPVVRGIDILGIRGPLPWGSRDTLRARRAGPDGSWREPLAGAGAGAAMVPPGSVGTSDGAVAAGGPGASPVLPVAWSTSEPGVAAVSADGVVTGTGPGEAILVAEYAGWLQDSVRVVVVDNGAAQEDILFRERLDDPGLPAWTFDTLHIQQRPTIVEADGAPALSLNGDGQYRDFFYTRTPMQLSQGATLHLDVRIPLTDRTNHQLLQVCLAETAPPGDPRNQRLLPTGNRFCFRYPSDELVKFREDLATVVAGRIDPPSEFSTEPFLPGDDWVRLTMVVRADGAASVLLDGEVVYSAEHPIELDPELPWRVALRGVSVDTEVLVRNVVLWRGERY